MANPTSTPTQLHDYINTTQAVDRAVLQIYNANLNEGDTRSALQMLAERISELLAKPDAGKRTLGRPDPAQKKEGKS